MKGPLRGEIVAPGEALTLVVVPHPLRTHTVTLIAPAGLTLSELVDRAEMVTGPGARFVATINGDRVARALWHRVRPKPDTLVMMRVVAEFGGDNSILRSLLSVAVLVGG